jgi:type III secretion protein T
MDPGYLALLESYPNLDYNVLWRAFLLTIMRVAPIVGLAPFLGAKLIPTTIRMIFALLLTFVFFPMVIGSLQDAPLTDAMFIGYAFKEIAIGFAIGYLSSIPFFTAQSSGILIDYLRGSSMFMAQDPTLQAQGSPIGVMLNLYMIALFYAVDGPFIFLGAVQNSFQLFPINALINPAFFNLQLPFWQTSLKVLSTVFALSIQLAAPSLLAILMAEMFLGIANRLAPQVQIAFLGMSLKSLMGLLLLWSAWFFLLRQMANFSLDWVNTLQKDLLTIPLSK